VSQLPRGERAGERAGGRAGGREGGLLSLFYLYHLSFVDYYLSSSPHDAEDADEAEEVDAREVVHPREVGEEADDHHDEVEDVPGVWHAPFG